VPVTQRFRLGSLTSEDEAHEFIAWCCARLGAGFHPDTYFSQYEEANGAKVFSKEEIDLCEALMEQAFQILEDPYEVALRMPSFAAAGNGPAEET
jgi:hypothetical protein